MAAINKRKLLESAQKNLQKGALDKALKDYQELLAADPRDTNVRLKVGDLQLKRGNSDEAISAYLKVADQFMRDGFDARAVAIYKQVTKIDAKRFDIYIPLADLYQRIGLTTDAMAALQTAAEAYQRDGRRREALDLLRRMASLDPTNTTSRLKVAELLQQEGLADEAVAEFDETAAELARQGDWEARAGVLQRLLDLAPERHETYEALIALWLERSQVGRAEPLARKLVSLDETRAESQETLAGVLHARGDEKGAIDAYRAAADAWIARGDEPRAREILQRHVPSEPFDAGAVPSGAITNPITESPFGEEGIGGEPPPTVDEFRFVDDGESAPLASGDDDFELEFDDAPPAAAPAAPPPKPAPRTASPTAPSEPAQTVVRELRAAPAPKPVAAPPSAPSRASAAPHAGDGGVADVEQLLAEAAVYLRYGKHERAVASLERALAQEPQHLGALEQLGDAQLRAENSAEAVAVWTRAHGVALATRDTDRASALRARIESVDAAAAAALAPPSRGAAAATVLFDAPLSEPERPAADAPSAGEGDLGEIEIDVDDDELGDSGASDADDTSSAEPAAPEVTSAAAAAEPEPGFEIEIDTATFGASDADASAAPAFDRDGLASATDDVPVPDSFLAADEAASEVAEDAPAFEHAIESEDAELSASGTTSAGEATEAAEPAVETAPAPAPPAQAVAAPPAAKSDGSEVSTTTSQQIVEDLEEASFYFEQGLLDEAEAIYRRVVERAPRHPGALLRLGEIAVARGQDPSRGGNAETAAAPPEAPVEAAAREAAPTIDPPDDLDLTAREFGPHGAWEGEAEDPVAAEAEIPVEEGASGGGDDATFDRTDPADWTTPDTEEPASVEAAAAAVEAPVAAQPTPQAVAEAAPPAPVVEPEPAPRPESVAASAPPPLELTAPEIRAEDDGAPAFDLAAELSEALRDEPATPARSSATDEDGFASLFREFKRGVSRTLDEGDVETHFDLGIAYREMGLLDDAIGVFHYALGSSARRLDALHMMGLCALDIGRAADAVGHLEQALASPEIPSEREVPLRYDLARAYEAQGDRERAIDAMARVVELDAAFQDATARLEALRSDAVVEDEPVEAAPAAEAYESFDDLIAQSADDAGDDASDGATAAPAETYESFDEFHGDDDEFHDDDVASEVEAEAAGESEDAVEAEPIEAEAVAGARVEAVVEAPASEPEPEPSPPDEKPRRRRKISFF